MIFHSGDLKAKDSNLGSIALEDTKDYMDFLFCWNHSAMVSELKVYRSLKWVRKKM